LLVLVGSGALPGAAIEWQATMGSQMARVDQVDALKAGAIIAVLVGHALFLEPPSWSVLHVLQAVPMFIVLMGFVGQWGTVGRRLLRLVPAFAILWLASLVVNMVFRHNEVGWIALTGYMPVTGPGNYFVPIAVWIAILLPFFRYLAKKSIYLLLFVTAAVNLAFELAAPHIGVFSTHPYLYSAAFPRYLLCVGFGFWLATKPRRRWVVVLGLASLVYLLGSLLWSWQPPFRLDWGDENLLAAGYPTLLVAVGLWCLPGRIPRAVSVLGQASYHIFLVQILVFVAIDSLSAVWRLALGVIGSTLLGLVWYALEQVVAKRLFAKWGPRAAQL
jgi:peptidoglycan/LPS O-acetylase OafA/YrhL